jgi:hypothetical protein
MIASPSCVKRAAGSQRPSAAGSWAVRAVQATLPMHACVAADSLPHHQTRPCATPLAIATARPLVPAGRPGRPVPASGHARTTAYGQEWTVDHTDYTHVSCHAGPGRGTCTPACMHQLPVDRQHQYESGRPARNAGQLGASQDGAGGAMIPGRRAADGALDGDGGDGPGVVGSRTL